MSKTVDPKKTYVGVVENNDDPKKIGRCQIRVMDVFENFKVEDLPWASPWKDLNGNQFNIPDKGKVVTVVFENGNTNNPEYISSDHYNTNLETKLQQLSKEDYLSMKSLLYDHKTQIYVNDKEGLKLDHKFNNVNIKEQSIDFNLKDNFGKVNVGSPSGTQRAILGDNFTNWFDTFLNILLGGGFLGNLAAPVVATPALMSHIQLYYQLKDPKLLSKHVYLVDNDSVQKQERTDGVTEAQKGDKWTSTVEENKITKKEEVKYASSDGSTSTTFEKPKPDETKPLVAYDLKPQKIDEHPDVETLLELLRMKNYKIYEKPYELNIVAIRNQCIASGDKYTDQFIDKLYALYKDDQNVWRVKNYVYSTVPGLEFTVSEKWLRDSKLDTINQIYWSNKIDQKITMKELKRGPVINNITIDKLNTNLVLSSILSNLNDKGKSFTKNLSSDPAVFDVLSKNANNIGIIDLTNIDQAKTALKNLSSVGLRNIFSYEIIQNLISIGINIEQTDININKVRLMGLDIMKLLTEEEYTKDENKKLEEQKIDVKKLKLELNTISTNTPQVNLKDALTFISLLGQYNNSNNSLSPNNQNQFNSLLGQISNLSGQAGISNLTNQGSNLISGLTNQAKNLTNQGNNLVGNLTNQGNNLVGNLTNQAKNLTSQGNNLVSNLTSQGTNLVSNLTSQGGNLASSLKNNLTNSLSSAMSFKDIQNLLSKGLDIDKVTNNLSTVKSLGIDLTKLNDLSKLSQDEISKLSASNINITKLKSDLSLISSNTNLNITDFLKSKN